KMMNCMLLKSKLLLAGIGLLVISACNSTNKIDRKVVVTRHNIVNTAIDSLESLTIGNGEFAFTVDVTGLQTFPDRYDEGVSLGTQSEWGWDRFTDTIGYKFEESLKEYDFNNDGHKATYSVQSTEKGRTQDAADWFRKNPHRLQLGNIGFDIYKKDGSLASPEDIQDITQELNLWTGEINSHFKVEGIDVLVQTVAHQDQDLVSVKVESDLINEGRLKIRLRYPYPTAEFLDEGTYWEE